MDELDLPSRLFESGFEPTGRKRVNNYFNLRWIDLLKQALEPDDLEKLMDSQFRMIMQMGGHTFSVMFLHYVLSRQLVTVKELELWWLFAGKPIRYAIQDFALVTGLLCGESGGFAGESTSQGMGRQKGTNKSRSSPSIWEELFHGEEKPTVGWIMERLTRGKKYKDPLTRFRLSLLVLVEGILCPTCGTTNIRPEVVNKLGCIEDFLKYPWGRESFLLTVRSTKSRSPVNYIQETMAIQGFSHAMVLVTVAACPSIIIRPGVDDPLSDPELSKTEIIQRVVDRKLVVNLVTAKSVDQLGQAPVDPRLCTDAEGELISHGLGDKEDGSVDSLISLIEEDYPFEHNAWFGGVRADDLKQKKCPPQTSESSEENVPAAAEKDNVPHGGVESGNNSGEPRVQSRRHNASHTAPEDHSHLDVPTLLRRAADAYEERVIPMFEGYVLSLKGHFNTEVGVLRSELQSATSSLSQLEKTVATELDSIRKVLKGSSYNFDDPSFGGGSPYRSDSPNLNRDEHVPEDFVQKDNRPIHSSVPTAGPSGESQTFPPSCGPDIETAPTTHPGGHHTKESGTSVPTEDTTAPVFPINVNTVEDVGEPMETEQPSKTADPQKEDHNPTRSTGEGTGEQVQSSHAAESHIQQESPQPSAAVEDVIPEPKINTTDQPLKEKEPVGVGFQSDPHVHIVDLTEDGPSKQGVEEGNAAEEYGADGLRKSKRKHVSPVRFSPSEPTVKEEGAKKSSKHATTTNKQPPKRLKKSAPTPVNPDTPRKEYPIFIGGYNAFDPASPSLREAFLKRLNGDNPIDVSTGTPFPVPCLSPLFHCTGVLTYEALDRVVISIRNRRDRDLSSRFDFVPPTFFRELLHNYAGFAAISEKDNFVFSTPLKSQFQYRPGWFDKVDFVYSPVLIKKTHWVGMILDLTLSAIYVVDSNSAFPSTEDVRTSLTPISIMLPHLFSRFCLVPNPGNHNFDPLPINRIEAPFLLEHPGFSAVGALILLETAAAGMPLNSVSFTESEARVAAEKYAISALPTP